MPAANFMQAISCYAYRCRCGVCAALFLFLHYEFASSCYRIGAHDSLLSLFTSVVYMCGKQPLVAQAISRDNSRVGQVMRR